MHGKFVDLKCISGCGREESHPRDALPYFIPCSVNTAPSCVYNNLSWRACKVQDSDSDQRLGSEHQRQQKLCWSKQSSHEHKRRNYHLHFIKFAFQDHVFIFRMFRKRRANARKYSFALPTTNKSNSKILLCLTNWGHAGTPLEANPAISPISKSPHDQFPQRLDAHFQSLCPIPNPFTIAVIGAM